MMTLDEREKTLKELARHSIPASERVRKHGSTQKVMSNSDIDDFDDDILLIPEPQVQDAMFYGIAGDIAAATVETGSRLNPVAVVLNYLSFLSANMGRNIYFEHENTPHPPLLFTLHVAGTGGGKDDSMGFTEKIRRYIQDDQPDILCPEIGCLSTAEGLTSLFPGASEPKNTTPDNRLHVVESEFVDVLIARGRKDSVLSSYLRRLYDGKNLTPSTKRDRITAINPHCAIHGAITGEELSVELKPRDFLNGFMNRFLIIHAERLEGISEATPIAPAIIEDISRRTVDIIRFAHGGHPCVYGRKASFSAEAQEMCQRIDEDLDKPLDTMLLTKLTSRSKPMYKRLALMFAITEKTTVIEARHILAGLSWVRYGIDSARYVFRAEAQDPKNMRLIQNKQKIIAFLRDQANGAAKSSALTKQCFKGKIDKSDLIKAIEQLNAEKKIEIIDGTTGGRGRPSKVIALRKTSKKIEFSEGHGWRGFQAGYEFEKNVEKNVEIIKSNPKSPRVV